MTESDGDGHADPARPRPSLPASVLPLTLLVPSFYTAPPDMDR